MADNSLNPPVPFQDVARLTFKAPDQKFSYGPSSLQVTEYWKAEDGAPLLAIIHGGCWLNAFDLRHVRALASEVAAQNIAVLSIEYRRIGDPGGGWPGTFEDVMGAFELATTLPHNAIYITGHSAGGHLALWIAANASDKRLRGAIGLAAISDLNTYSKGTSSCQRATIDLLGGRADEQAERYKLASPLGLSYEVPLQLIHGTADPIVSPELSTAFCTAHEARCSLFYGLGHFDVIDPRQDPVREMVEQIRTWQARD